MQADDVAGPLAQDGGRPRAVRPPLAVQRVSPPRPPHVGREVELAVDHRLERLQQAGEPFGIALEHAEHMRQRLDGGDAVFGGLFPDPVAAGGRWREADLRQRPERGVALRQLPRQPPGAVDDHQRDRPIDRHIGDVDRVRSGEEHIGRAPVFARQRRLHLGVVVEVDADVQLRIRKAEVGETRRPDRHELLTRVLKQHHARPRRQRHQVRAVTNGLGSSAPRADRPVSRWLGNHGAENSASVRCEAHHQRGPLTLALSPAARGEGDRNR